MGIRAAAVLIWAAAASCVQGGAPPDVHLEAADSAVADWVAAERIPGAVLLVTRDGRPLLERAYGHARLYAYGSGQYDDPGGIRKLDDPAPMTVETVFDLASITKVAATTSAVMLLVEAGQVDLDAPVATYLDDFRGDGRDVVTVRHLLSHTGGLRPWVPTYYHASTADEAYAYIRGLPLAWTPGEERHYSDLGFMLLGRIVEEVTGRRLDRFVTEELFEPLGLVATGFRPVGEEVAASRGEDAAATSHGNPYERRMVHDPDFGYRIEGDPDAWSGWRERTLVGEVNDGNAFHAFEGVAGHAGLFSTARELEKLVRLVAGGGEIDGVRHLERETVRSFLRPEVEGQALGWQLPSYAPDGAFGHTGFTGTFVLARPADGLVVVLLTNRQNVGVDADTGYPDVGPLQRAVTRAIFGAGAPTDDGP